MRFSTDLFGRWLSSLAPKAAGRESLQAQDVTVPAAIQPVIRVFYPFPSRIAVAVPSNVNGSFGATLQNLQPASTGAVSQAIATLAAGPWVLGLSLSSLTDFTTTPAGLLRTQLVLADPTGNQLPILTHPAVANVPQASYAECEVVLPVDGWQLVAIQTATVVGQTMAGWFTVNARRPL